MARKSQKTSETGLSDEFRINSRGRPETVAALNRLEDIANQCLARTIWKRKVGHAPIVNALILYFDRMPKDQKVEILEKSTQILFDVINGHKLNPLPESEAATPPWNYVAAVRSPKERDTGLLGRRKTGRLRDRHASPWRGRKKRMPGDTPSKGDIVAQS